MAAIERVADTAILFPGQGSHDADARGHVEHHAPSLLELCIDLVGEDPFPRAGESTRFAQPAIFLASLARWTASDIQRTPVAYAGHSLGEITALTAAGALAPEDALHIVVERGRLMSEAQAGGMIVVRADAEAAAELASATGTVVANDNGPGQVVLSGSERALAAVKPEAKERGIKARRLDVAGAFHSPLMRAAARGLRGVMADIPVHRPTAPVMCCATARPFHDVRAQLPLAVTSPVRWREVLDILDARGSRRFLDVGPGDVLSGLVRRTLPHAEIVEVGDALVA
ncbi:MAG: ACP S-malonyltransferase [Baekduiaceae bacterium]